MAVSMQCPVHGMCPLYRAKRPAVPKVPPSSTAVPRPRFKANGAQPGSLMTTRALPAGVEHLLADSTVPILKIVLCCSVGAWCAKKGMIDLEARRTLSKLAIDVFTPALMISKLGAHIDAQQALALWPIGANVIICHLVGLALGVCHTKLVPTPPHLTNIIRVSTAISNTGNLPLVMVMSFVKNPHLPFNSAAEAELAVSYVMLGWFYATMVQMPLGHWLLHKDEPDSLSSSKAAAGQQTQQPVTAPAATVLPAVDGAAAVGGVQPAAANLHDSLQLKVAQLEQLWQSGITTDVLGWQQQQQQQQLEADIASRPMSSTAARLPAIAAMAAIMPAAVSNGTQPGMTCAVSSAESNSSSSSRGDGAGANNSSSCADNTSDSTGGLSGMTTEQRHQQWQQYWQAMQPFMKGVLSAPLLAGLAAIAIGSCPQLRDALFTPGGSLSLVGDCLDMMGQPLIPILLLVLGANLANGPGPGHLPMANVVGVVATRLLLLPLLGCLAVLTAQRASLISVQDPLALVVMMVAWSTPTAILVHSLASVHRNGEDEVSALLFWEYLACIVTLPLCSAAYLYLIGCCMSYAA